MTKKGEPRKSVRAEAVRCRDAEVGKKKGIVGITPAATDA